MRIRKRRIAIDRAPATVRRLFELLCTQIGPGARRKPDDHQEVARAKPNGLLHILNSGIAFSAKCVGSAKVSARESRVRIEFYCPQQSPDRVVVLTEEQLMNGERGVSRRVLLVGSYSAARRFAHTRPGLRGCIRPSEQRGEVQRKGEISQRQRVVGLAAQ